MATSQKNSTPRGRRYQRTRQSIITTAQKIIATEGINGLSMRAIAAQIDYSPAGLYEYFDSKDDIIQAVCLDGWQRLQKHLQQIAEIENPNDAIQRFAALYTEFAHRNPVNFHLIFSYGLQTNRATAPFTFPEMFGSLSSVIRKGIENEKFKLRQNLDEREMVRAIWSLIHGFATFRMLQESDAHLELTPVEQTILNNLLESFRFDPV